MNCRKVQSQLSAFADGELVGMQMLTLNRHLNECAACRRELDQVLELKSALGSLASAEPTAEFKMRLRDAVRTESQRHRRAQPAFGFFATALATAVVVFAFLQVGRQQAGSAQASPTESAPQVNLVQDQAVMGADDPFSTTSPFFLASSRGE